MKKTIISILLVAVLVMTLSVSAWAAIPYVSDGSGLLTSQEWGELENQCKAIYEQCGFAPYIVTTDSFNGMSAEEYAGNYYDTMGCQFDGILLLVSLEEGYWYILTNGACHDYIPDSKVDKIGEDVVDALRDGDYAGACQEFLDGGVSYMEKGENPPLFTGGQILISLGGGLVIALIVVLVMVSKMKTVKPNPTANFYVRNGSMCVTNSRDIFLYSNVTRTRRQSNSSSGGGGSRGGGSRGGAGGRI